MFSSLDIFYARLYATEKLKKLKYDKFKMTHSHIFDYITISERMANKNDYYIPYSLRHECKMYDLNFTKLSCEKIQCFPFSNYPDVLCTQKDETKTLHLGEGFKLGCQPACFKLFQGKYKNMILDTYYEDHQCKVANHLLSLFALAPPSRLKGITLSVVDHDQLFLTKNYCEAHGVRFRSFDCVTAQGQEIAEIVIGKTVFRLTYASMNKNTLKPLPPIPSHLSTDWNKKNRVKRNISSRQQPHANTHTTSPSETIDPNMLKQIMNELLIDTGVDLTLDLTEHILKKTIPNKLINHVNVGTLATFLHYQMNLPKYLLALKFLGRAIGAINTIYGIYALTTTLVDIFDPAHLNKMLNKKSLDLINRKLQVDFSQIYPDRILKPEFLFSLLDNELEEDENVVKFIDDQILKYLNSLDVNATGQRIKIQIEIKHEIEKRIATTKKKEKNNNYYFIPVFTLVIIICLITVITMNRILPYIIILYFLFIMLFY